MKFADIADITIPAAESGNDRGRAPRPAIRVAGRGSGYLARWSVPSGSIGVFQPADRTDFPTSVGRTTLESGVGVGAINICSSGLTLSRVAGFLGRSGSRSQVDLIIARSPAADHPSCLTAPRPEPRRREPSPAVTTDAPPYLALARRLLERDDIEAARTMLDAVPLDVPEVHEVQRLRTLLAPPRVTSIPARDADRSREYRWFRQNWHNYRGQWVALDGDQVLASARTLKELRETLKTLNLARPPLVHRLD